MNYQDFAKAVYDELKPGESFEEWDSHTFYSSEPIPKEMTHCERRFIKGHSEHPYILNGDLYILVQLSCMGGVWQIFTSDQSVTSSLVYPDKAQALSAWTALLG